MELVKNQTIPLKIISLSNDGNGVGKFDEQVVFVPFAAPGDELLVKIVKVCKGYSFGIIESIFNPSECRIEPDCPIFGKCGGCAFRHITYEEELVQKQKFVEDSFLRIGKLSVSAAHILPSPQRERYRNKVQLPVYEDENGRLCTGFYAGRSHRIVPCNDCMLQPKLFSDIAEYLCDILTQHKITAYKEETGKGILRHIFLRHAVSSGKVMVCLVINAKKLNNETEICEALTARFSEISGVVLNINKSRTNVIMGENSRTIAGEGCLNDNLSGVPVKLNPLSFYQVNTKGAEQLYAVTAAFAALTKTDTLLDLYCGAGTIGLSMAHFCKELIGVEIVSEAVDNAKQNAEAMGIKNARFICADASKAAAQLYSEGLHPNVIVLDPPRKGCDEDGLKAICQMSPQKIVMVSCNPSTAARDCAYLAKNGYSLSAVQPVDMFPRTKHVECVVLLVKAIYD